MPYIFVDKLLKEKNAKKHLFTAFPLKAKMIFIHRRGKVNFFDWYYLDIFIIVTKVHIYTPSVLKDNHKSEEKLSYTSTLQGYCFECVMQIHVVGYILYCKNECDTLSGFLGL